MKPTEQGASTATTLANSIFIILTWSMITKTETLPNMQDYCEFVMQSCAALKGNVTSHPKHDKHTVYLR